MMSVMSMIYNLFVINRENFVFLKVILGVFIIFGKVIYFIFNVKFELFVCQRFLDFIGYYFKVDNYNFVVSQMEVIQFGIIL